MTRSTLGIAAVWAAALLGALAIGLAVAPQLQLTVVTLLMLALFFAAAVIELFTAGSDGFIRRMTISTVGALAILAAATLAMACAGGAGSVVGAL